MTSMVTVPKLSQAVESIRFMPARPASLSSIRRMMASSTSAGEAPGYSVEMEMLSREVSGKISSFMVTHVMIPASIKNIINRLAAT